MAGLLNDIFGNADQTQAIGLLGLGLMNRNFAGGAQAAMQHMAGAKERELKQGLLSAQIAETLAQSKERESNVEKAASLRRLIAENFGPGVPSQPTVPGQLGSGSFGVVAPPEGMPAIPPTAPAGSRISRMSPDAVAMLKLNGADLTELWKTAKEGFTKQPGTFSVDPSTGARTYNPDPTKGFNFDPATGIVSPMQNFAQANAQIKGAETSATERAKAQNQLLPLDYVSAETGRPIGGSVGSYMDRATPMQNIGGGSISPELAAFIRQDAAANGIANPQAKFIGGGQQSTYGLAQAPSTSPRLQSKAEGEGAISAARLPYQTGEKVNETWLKSSYEPAISDGNAANETLVNVKVARDSMRAMGSTGWGTPIRATAASVLSGLGMAPDSAKLYAANAETFQQAAMSTLWTRLNAAKGVQAEGDADRASKTFAQLKNTPQANEFILDLTEAKAERDRMRSAFFQQGLPIARQKGDLQEVEREWLKRAPSVFSLPSMRRWSAR